MDDFDFGFTIEESIEVDDRAERIFTAVDSFLERLKKNPKAETIKWPNRAEELTAFQAKLKAILNGERNGK